MLDLVFHQVVSYLSVCVPCGTMRDVSIEGQSDNKLKELFYASSIPIQDPSCCLALFVWKIWHLVRNSSISWSLCLLIHLWSCLSLSRSITTTLQLEPIHKTKGRYLSFKIDLSKPWPDSGQFLCFHFYSISHLLKTFSIFGQSGYGSKWNYVWSCITLKMFLLFRGPHSVKRTE